MSKKKDRAWFVCPQWAELVSGHYASDAEAARALKTDPKVLARLRSRRPVAKSTVLRSLRVFASRHDVASPIADLVVDTRSR
jgi:septal ring-binding cell division protein DamX